MRQRFFRSFWAASILMSLMAGATAHAGCPVPDLPSEIVVDRKLLSWGDSFTLTGGGRNVGKVSEKIISLTKSFSYADSNGSKIATANEAIISVGKRINISDCEGHYLGSIQENVFKTMFGAGIKSSYSITNANGHEIAKSEKTEWFNAKIRIIDRSGNLIAEISRATSVFSHALDRWKIKIINRSAFDSRIAVMIVAYKAAADLEREAESESDSD